MTVHHYQFGSLTVDGNMIIGEMREAEDIGVEVMHETFRLARETFGDAPWAYISNRSNSYSLQPIVYVRARETDTNLVAYAVVLPSSRTQIYTDTEKMLVDDHFEYAVFHSMDDARAWAESILSRSSNQPSS